MDIKTVRAHKYEIPRSTKILHLYLNYCNIGVNRFMYLFSKPAEEVQIYLIAYSSTHVYKIVNEVIRLTQYEIQSEFLFVGCLIIYKIPA